MMPRMTRRLFKAMSFDELVELTDDYIYDRSMWILETPTPINCEEDLEEYIDFDEE